MLETLLIATHRNTIHTKRIDTFRTLQTTSDIPTTINKVSSIDQAAKPLRPSGDGHCTSQTGARSRSIFRHAVNLRQGWGKLVRCDTATIGSSGHPWEHPQARDANSAHILQRKRNRRSGTITCRRSGSASWYCSVACNSSGKIRRNPIQSSLTSLVISACTSGLRFLKSK